jgi:hypothetical protein
MTHTLVVSTPTSRPAQKLLAIDHIPYEERELRLRNLCSQPIAEAAGRADGSSTKSKLPVDLWLRLACCHVGRRATPVTKTREEGRRFRTYPANKTIKSSR